MAISSHFFVFQAGTPKITFLVDCGRLPSEVVDCYLQHFSTAFFYLLHHKDRNLFGTGGTTGESLK